MFTSLRASGADTSTAGTTATYARKNAHVQAATNAPRYPFQSVIAPETASDMNSVMSPTNTHSR